MIRDLPVRASNCRRAWTCPSTSSATRTVVAIADIDTRKLTRILRDKGAQDGCIMAGEVDEDCAGAGARRSRAWPAWISPKS